MLKIRPYQSTRNKIQLLLVERRRRFNSSFLKDLLDCTVELAEFNALTIVTSSSWVGVSFQNMHLYTSYSVLISRIGDNINCPLNIFPISSDELFCSYEDPGIQVQAKKIQSLIGSKGVG
jgi:hypothetical protein